MPYTVIKTDLSEVLILEPKVFGDDRGFFFESFNQRDFQQATGLDVNFVMDLMNRARSRMNLVILDACRNNPFSRSFRSAASSCRGSTLTGGRPIRWIVTVSPTATRRFAAVCRAARTPFTAPTPQALRGAPPWVGPLVPLWGGLAVCSTR